MEILSAPLSDCGKRLVDTPCGYLPVGHRGAALDSDGLRMAPFFHRFNGLAFFLSLPALPGVVFHPIPDKPSPDQGLCSLRPAQVRQFG